jgi:hypothetical protein
MYSRQRQVVLVYTSPSSKEKAEKVASEITNLNNGSKTHIVQADLAQIEAPEKIVASTREVRHVPVRIVDEIHTDFIHPHLRYSEMKSTF